MSVSSDNSLNVGSIAGLRTYWWGILRRSIAAVPSGMQSTGKRTLIRIGQG